MLTYREMKEHIATMVESVGELSEGKTYHLDHVGCPAGNDRKRRFYITRRMGDMLCYCQHCGHGGLFSGGRERRFDVEVYADCTVVPRLSSAHFEYSNGSAILDWSEAQKLWWYSHEMEDIDSIQYGVRSFSNRLYIYGSESLYIARSFKSGAPKYIRSQGKDSYGYVGFVNGNGPVYIVEDVLSCYKLHKAGWNAIALLGTKMSSEARREVAAMQREGTEVVLWLDQDMAGRRGSQKLYKELSPMGLVSVVTSVLEPKQTALDVLVDKVAMEYIRTKP